MTPLLEMTSEQLAALLAAWDQPAYRADQILGWLYRRGAVSYDEMTNLPRELRRRLAEEVAFVDTRVERRTDTPDGVCKLLLGLADGETTETVLIPTDRRSTACLSTQVGCAVGCGFCASGIDGRVRDLSTAEILQQVLQLQRATDRQVTHAVFMGMGEPLANFDATVAAVEALVDERRFGLSARRVTVSTVGLPEAIRRLARLNLPITLAISLHAPDDALRRRIIPAARLARIEKVLSAAREFYSSRKREITLEYVLLRGVNDTDACADALARIAHSVRCNVNLIRYNPVARLGFERPGDVEVARFAARLEKRGVNVQVRRSRGVEADAACGQLRRRRGGGP